MLTPNATYNLNGVTVREKIIPDGTRWKNAEKAVKAGFEANALYKKQKKLSGNTGKVQSVTIHNTNDLAGVYDDGEQYTRATYNENMNSARVHFYVDDTGAWQNLKAGTGLTTADPLGCAEVSWHSGDGSVSDGGNMTSLSMEIIMKENAANDAKAYDNGARIAAWLLWKNGLGVDKLLTHTYWVNKTVGKRFSDVDEQCTNMISGKKWCPSYIFNSSNHTTALANWMKFKATVQGYIDVLNGNNKKPNVTPPESSEEKKTETVKGAFEVGDVVKITGSTYYGGQTIPSWVKAKNWIVRSVGGNRIVVDKSQDGKHSIRSAIHAKDLEIVYSSKPASNPKSTVTDTISVGDKVMCNSGVTTYYNGVKMASWVPKSVLYVRQIEQGGKRLLVSTEPVKAVYTGRVNASDVHKI